MARRSRGWNVGLVHDPQESKFAREFLSAVEVAFLFRSRLARWFVPWTCRKLQLASPNGSACDQPCAATRLTTRCGFR